MKFLLTKELKDNQLLRFVVLFFLAIITLFLLSDILLHHYQIGLSFEKAKETLLGNEEAFIEPLLFDVLLEKIHIGIFTSMITLMLISIISIRVSHTQKSKVIHLAFISAILTPLSLLIAYFYGGIFILVWIGLFLLWHFCAIYLCMTSVWSLLKT